MFVQIQDLVKHQKKLLQSQTSQNHAVAVAPEVRPVSLFNLPIEIIHEYFLNKDSFLEIDDIASFLFSCRELFTAGQERNLVQMCLAEKYQVPRLAQLQYHPHLRGLSLLNASEDLCGVECGTPAGLEKILSLYAKNMEQSIVDEICLSFF